MRTDRFTLAAITVAAVLAAFLTATWIPTQFTPGPLLTWAVTYTGTIAALARIVNLPVGRTLCATSLLATATVRVLFVGARVGVDQIRAGLDQIVAGLDYLTQRGTNLLATSPKAA